MDLKLKNDYSDVVGVDLRKPKSEFKKGLITGANQVQQFGYGAASLLGAAVGSEKLQEAGARGYERQQDDMELNQLRVGRVEDVKGVGDAFDYAQGVVAQLIPNLAPMILGGGVGGLAGKAVIKKQIKKNIGKGMSPGAAADAAAKSIASKAGVTGATAANIGTMSGSVAGQQLDETGEIHTGKALTAGAIAGSLDVLPIFGPFGILNKFKSGAGDEVKNRATKLLADAGVSGSKEATTEVIQSAIEQAAVDAVKLDVDNWSMDEIEQLLSEVGKNTDWLNSAVAGAVGGSAIGGAGGAAGLARDAVTGRQSETKVATDATAEVDQQPEDTQETNAPEEVSQESVAAEETPLAEPVGDPTVESASFPERQADQLPATTEAELSDPDLDTVEEDAIIEQALANPDLPPEVRKVLEGEYIPAGEDPQAPGIEQQRDPIDGTTSPLEGEYQPRGEGIRQEVPALEKQGQVIDYGDHGKLDVAPKLLEAGTERAKQDAARIENKIDVSLADIDQKLKEAATPFAEAMLRAQKKQVEDKKQQLVGQQEQIELYEQDAKEQRRWLDSFNSLQGLAQPKDAPEGQVPKLAKIRKSDVVREGDAMPDDIQNQIFDAYQRMQKAGLPPEAWNELVDSVPEDVNGQVLADEIDRRTAVFDACLLYTSPSPRDATLSRMPSSA